MKTHIVQKGETLWEIAKVYKIDFQKVKQANPQLASPEMIMPGMKVNIPSTQKKEVDEPKKKEVSNKQESPPATQKTNTNDPKPMTYKNRPRASLSEVSEEQAERKVGMSEDHLRDEQIPMALREEQTNHHLLQSHHTYTTPQIPMMYSSPRPTCYNQWAAWDPYAYYNSQQQMYYVPIQQQWPVSMPLTYHCPCTSNISKSFEQRSFNDKINLHGNHIAQNHLNEQHVNGNKSCLSDSHSSLIRDNTDDTNIETRRLEDESSCSIQKNESTDNCNEPRQVEQSSKAIYDYTVQNFHQIMPVEYRHLDQI